MAAPANTCTLGLGLPLQLSQEAWDALPAADADRIDNVNARYICGCQADTLTPDDRALMCEGAAGSG